DLVARIDALENVSATRREDTPEHLHFRDNDRIAPIVVRPDLGYTVTTRADAEADPDLPIPGSHGYDVRERDMHALFVASGPSFRRGARVGPLATVDVHGILARALGIEAAPNAGDPGAADLVMEKEPVVKR
ncbi:MAG: alkaline phosphatase family protein, partial [Bacteroidota bacterium]